MISRLLFITFLVFGFSRTGILRGQEPQPLQPVTPQTTLVPVVYPGVPVAYPPPILYRPRIVYQPYQLQGAQVYRRFYATPIRNALFGRYRSQAIYTPMVRQ